MDALLGEALTTGATQVVNLGAGFDSRAYRSANGSRACGFSSWIFLRRWRPSARVVKIFGAVPDRVVLIATDFSTHPLADVLREAGYVGRSGHSSSGKASPCTCPRQPP